MMCRVAEGVGDFLPGLEGPDLGVIEKDHIALAGHVVNRMLVVDKVIEGNL